MERYQTAQGRNSQMDGKAMWVGAFYVKGLVAFVPHLILPGHVPSCPHCRNSKWVDTPSSRWIKTPKICFGINTHKYLDTKLYKCTRCARSFTGYNKRSLELDSGKWVGLFDYHLTKTYAVDPMLYSDIVASKSDKAEVIARRCRQRVVDNYLSDFNCYLYAVGAEMIRKQERNSVPHDGRQGTLDGVLL